VQDFISIFGRSKVLSKKANYSSRFGKAPYRPSKFVIHKSNTLKLLCCSRSGLMVTLTNFPRTMIYKTFTPFRQWHHEHARDENEEEGEDEVEDDKNLPIFFGLSLIDCYATTISSD
ncbi:MAG: hypothetical protein M3299_15440, partial [Thermoproteota archaeon]|nr:hypothetical protein [Thermoproteota archaeon]